MSLQEKILNILEEIRPDQDFENGSDFLKNGMLDSVDIANLVGALEDTFGIEIPMTQMIPINFLNIDRIEVLVNKCWED